MGVRIAIGVALFLGATLESSAQAANRCFLLGPPGLREVTTRELVETPPALQLAPGERLEYAVRYLGVDVGRGSVEIARIVEWEGRRLAHVIATARTNAVFSLFYRVDDRMEAWIDVDDGVTRKTATHTRHGRNKEVYEEVEFDWETHFVTILENKRHKRRTHEVAFDFGPFVHDSFDVFYAIRALGLAPGVSVELPVYAEQKVFALGVSVERRERLSSPVFGDTEALVVQPRDLLDGRPAGRGAGEIWLSADEHRVPLRIKGWFNTNESFHVGNIRGDLVAYQPGQRPWQSEKAPPRASVRTPVPTRDGRPLWNAPSSVVGARERRGVEPVDRRFATAWPSGLGCPESPPVNANAAIPAGAG